MNAGSVDRRSDAAESAAVTTLHAALGIASDPRNFFTWCHDHHVARSVPRVLVTVQRAMTTDRPLGPLLQVSVSECRSMLDPSKASGLIILRGELDTDGADSARNLLLEYARSAGSVVLDLTDLDTIDHGGALLIEAMHAVVDRGGGSLTVHDPGVVVQRVLELYGVESPLRFCCPRPDRTV